MVTARERLNTLAHRRRSMSTTPHVTAFYGRRNEDGGTWAFRKLPISTLTLVALSLNVPRGTKAQKTLNELLLFVARRASSFDWHLSHLRKPPMDIPFWLTATMPAWLEGGCRWWRTRWMRSYAKPLRCGYHEVYFM